MQLQEGHEYQVRGLGCNFVTVRKLYEVDYFFFKVRYARCEVTTGRDGVWYKHSEYFDIREKALSKRII